MHDSDDNMIVDSTDLVTLLQKLQEHIERLQASEREKKKRIDNLHQELRRCQEEIHRLRDENRKVWQKMCRSEKEVPSPHFGDRNYWTPRRLYQLRVRHPDLSYRDMEEKTGIPKSTIQRRVAHYRQHLHRPEKPSDEEVH